MALPGLYRQKSLVYPAGRKPGFDPTHPLSSVGTVTTSVQFLMSAVLNTGNAKFITLGNKTGAATTVSVVLDSVLGPCTSFTAAASHISLASVGTFGATGGTWGLIIRTPAAFPTTADIVWNDSSGGGWGLSCPSGTFELRSTGGSTSLSITLAVSTPYLLLVSNGPSHQAAVVKNLNTGAVTTHTGTSSLGGIGASNGTLELGNTQGTGSSYTGLMAAAMFNSAYFSLQQLIQVAYDPWSFWYPDPTFAVSQVFMPQAPQGAAVIDVPLGFIPRTWAPGWSPLGQLLRNSAQDTSSSAVETNPHWQGKTYPPQWLADRKLLINHRAVVESSSAVETNPHTAFKTLPPQWIKNPILLLNTAQDFSSSAVETNPHWKGIQWPPQWAINKPLFRVTAQDFSASAVETNVHAIFKTWPPQWLPLAKLRQTDPQDFSSSAVETNVHTVFKTWPLQWSLALRENSDPNSSTPVQPETNVHFIPRTYPPQWAPLKNLQNTAQDFSSSAVETNVHTIFRTWPYQWARTAGLLTAPDTSETGVIQPETNVFFVPRTYPPQWAPLKNLQNTAQDFSSSAVETNVHTAFRTWPPQWVMLLRTQNTAQDFSSSAVETNPHWIGKPWPIQWAPAIALRTTPATDVPILPFDTPPPTAFRTWLPQWLVNLPLLRGTAQDFSSTAVETNVHFIPHTWPPQWNLQASLKQGTAQDFSTAPPAFVEIYENQFFSAFARIGAIGRNP